jgi:hypothetical protein
MPHAITWIDRLRIEGTVWALDQRIYDLPRQSRIAKRREVRANLLTAASDVGTSAALRNLGGSRRLAVEYRDAEYGEEPRPNWIAAALFLGMSQAPGSPRRAPSSDPGLAQAPRSAGW